MPKIGKKPIHGSPQESVHPIYQNGKRIADEIFHLERTISNSDRMNADLAGVVDSLDSRIDILSDHVENLVSRIDELNETMKTTNSVLDKILQRMEAGDA